MPRPSILVTDIIDRAAEETIGAGLRKFNEEQSRISDLRRLAVILQDPESQETLGGDRPHVARTAVPRSVFRAADAARRGARHADLAPVRGRGAARGCRSAMLYTISFQAPEFYARNGWTKFGEIPCDPPGTSRIFMTKPL